MYSLFQNYQDMYFIEQEKKNLYWGANNTNIKRIDRNSQDFTQAWIRVSLCIENYSAMTSCIRIESLYICSMEVPINQVSNFMQKCFGI